MPRKKRIIKKKTTSTTKSKHSTKIAKTRNSPRKAIKKVIRESTKKVKFQTPKGTFDILPKDWKYWNKIKETVDQLATAYGFSPFETPIIEDAQLFKKGTGITTDIVQKEMFTLRTRGGDNLVLRPEFTPSIIRAYIEHGMKTWTQPVKLYSIGPVFRYERPQAGRFRQFHQFNLETIGEIDPINDALLLQLAYLIFKKLGIEKLNLEINSIGCPECRPRYKKLLINYYKKQKKKLCKNCNERLKTNPLRLLDCKEEKCMQLANNAPQMIDNLCDECHNHFKEVLEILDETEIPYILNPKLVRGLDYYTKTVFEFKTGEGSYSGELGGGGRYDELVKLLGGKSTPAVGFACGIERIISVLKSQNIKIPEKKAIQVFLIQVGELGKKKSLKLFEELRKNGLKIAEALSKTSIKSQLRAADKLGVKIALIFGQKEALENNIIIRNMKSGNQETIPLDRVIEQVKKRLKK